MRQALTCIFDQRIETRVLRPQFLARRCDLIERLLRSDGAWRDDERLVVFTEYKTTLDYLTRRLRQHYDDDRILTLFGGMDDVVKDLYGA